MVKKSGAEIPDDPASMGRIKQIRMVAGIVRERNPRALPLVALAGVGTAAVLILIGSTEWMRKGSMSVRKLTRVMLPTAGKSEQLLSR